MRSTPTTRLPLAVLLALFAPACATEDPRPELTDDGESAQAGASQAASTARPAEGELARQRRPGEPLAFTPRDGWMEEEPSSSMRAAQYLLPGEAGAAELVVFYFGSGQGGSVEANVARWASQFEQTDGADPLERARRSERRVAGMPVHELALEGTYVAETRPGSGERVHEPEWALLAAIVESDHGPYYLKLTGPEATVRARAGEFRAFVSELR